MDIKLINKWEVIIKLIIYSQAIKEYQEYFNILQELEKDVWGFLIICVSLFYKVTNLD
ncbi:hypothetical protein [Spiroplasma endosymbiont of Phycita roborella]|uniref:hypothetical protein n=1 Tax=Spiroplasma endosymbiont of Phycita roborella TaxID=3066311 RepID=UPI00313BE909